MLDIITIGDIKLDTFVQINDASVQCEVRMPECKLCLDYGAKVAVDKVESQMAGSAPNVAVGLSRLGHKTAVLSNMGTDGTRALSLERLTEEKVDSSLVFANKDAQSSYSVVLNYQGDRTILTSHIKHEYRLPKRLPKTDWLYVSEIGDGYEDLYSDIVAYKKNHDVKIGCNPGSIQIQERKSELLALLKITDIIFINLEEAQQITQSSSKAPHTLMSELSKIGVKTVILTDGKRGAFAYENKKLYAVPIFPGKAVETTGAGDAFATGYLGAILAKKPLEDALKWGVVNSSSVVGHIGPQPGLLRKTQMLKHLREAPTTFVVEEIS